MVTFETVKNNANIRTYIEKADESLTQIGYTEHSFPHVTKVSDSAAYILSELGYSAHDIELVKIAGFLHDIGNLVNRYDHAQTGALMAFRILDEMGMCAEDVSTVVTAIGNHDEGTGIAINPTTAALILADKTDVRKSRVRNYDIATFDKHDRVNYSVENSNLSVSSDKKCIILELRINTDISSVFDYFDIFLIRMNMCRKAAQTLGLKFELIINDKQML